MRGLLGGTASPVSRVRRRAAAALVLPIVLSFAAVLAPSVLGASDAATPPQAAGTTDGPFVYQYPAPASAGPDAGSLFAVIGFGSPRRPSDPVFTGSTPAWSPSGERFAFARGALGHRQIYLANVDGTNITGPITRQTTEAKDPTWSPDGSTLAFTGTRDGVRQIWSVTVAGTAEHQLTNDPGGAIQPAWSPSSTTPEIAFTSLQSGFALWLMSADGTGAHPVTNAPSGAVNPAWRDDTTLAFAAGPETGRSIYTIDRDGTNLRRLTYGDIDGFPSFSPAGDAIAFTRTHNSVPAIYVLPLTPAGTAAAAPSPLIAKATHAHWGPLPLPGDPAQVPRAMAVIAPLTPGRLVRLSAPAATRDVLLGAAGARVSAGYTVHAPDGVNLAANVAASPARPQTTVTTGATATGTFQLVKPVQSDTLSLALPTLAGCPGAPAASSAAKRQAGKSPAYAVKIDHPHSKGGKVAVNTHDANASSLGTVWSTEETCAGTTIKVLKDAVAVTDLGRGRTLTVAAGHTYFARRVP